VLVLVRQVFLLLVCCILFHEPLGDRLCRLWVGCMLDADGLKFGDRSAKRVVKSKGFPIYKDGHLLSMMGICMVRSAPKAWDFDLADVCNRWWRGSNYVFEQ
jgi:hypothetical protein